MTLYQKMEIFHILRSAFPPPAPIELKFCTAKWTQLPVGLATFDVNYCYESPLGNEKPDFRPVNKFNTGSLPLCGILPVIKVSGDFVLLFLVYFRCKKRIRPWFCGSRMVHVLWVMPVLVISSVDSARSDSNSTEPSSRM